MSCVEDFLTNNCYRFISILFGFAFVFFTGIFDNYDKYYYLTPDQIPNNSTNEFHDDDDSFDSINYMNSTTDNNTLWRCEKIVNSMHYYRGLNAFIYTILFMYMSCFNFKILETRKLFCKMFISGTLINMFIGGIILLADGALKCYNIINDQYKYMQIITVVNYLIMIIYMAIFMEYICKNNNKNYQQNINNNNTNSTYLPKYSEITNDKPPSYQENYVITISPPLLQNIQ